MAEAIKEQLFSRQEQAVVYLFSRYWDKIDRFRNKRISRIHTHFPDFTLEDVSSGAEEGIEFEYGLSDFSSHIPKDLRKLNKEGIKRLYIVYWDEDIDKDELREEVKEHFKGEPVLVCLKDHFSPCVTSEPKHLVPGWVFCQCKQLPEEVYSFDAIAEEEKRLMAESNVRRLKPAKGLYRTAGYNTEAAGSVELDHWKMIHLYLTTRFAEENIPTKLFVKPSGCQCFSGYFEIDHAFHITKGGEPAREFFGRYYFFPYEDYYDKYTCLVYSRFRQLTYDQGRSLYKSLKKRRFALRLTSELIQNDEHIRDVDRIIGRE